MNNIQLPGESSKRLLPVKTEGKSMIRVGIVGATGFVAEELVRILMQHPAAQVTELVSSSHQGKRLDEVFPSFKGFAPLILSVYDEVRLGATCDVVFLALPHGKSAPLAAGLLSQGLKVIDLSADFRYQSRQQYETTYKVSHCCPDLLPHAAYGLCEIYEDRIAKSNLVANPGCYTTCSLLSLIPLVENGILQPESIIIDAKSGVSGAGNHLSQTSQFTSVSGNFKAYGVGNHRHTSEIEEQLGFHLPADSVETIDPGETAVGNDCVSSPPKRTVNISFTPHLLPVKRGILTTIYGSPAKGKAFGPSAEQEVTAVYRKYYGGKPFVHINPPGEMPELSHVVGSNGFHLGFVIDRRVNRIIVTSVIDNLIKGAAGQAIQNMNLLFGLDQTTGLRLPAWYL
jgi:N-acetyl-gamma-glutamyl-phosphate reductase